MCGGRSSKEVNIEGENLEELEGLSMKAFIQFVLSVEYMVTIEISA